MTKKHRFLIRLITFTVITAMVCQNIVLAGGENCLMPRSEAGKIAGMSPCDLWKRFSREPKSLTPQEILRLLEFLRSYPNLSEGAEGVFEALQALTKRAEGLSLKDMWQIVLAYNAVIEKRSFTWARKMRLWDERNFWRERLWNKFKDSHRGKGRLQWNDFACEVQADYEEFKKACYDFLLEKYGGNLRNIGKDMADNYRKIISVKNVEANLRQNNLVYKWYLTRALEKIRKREKLDLDERYEIIYEFIDGDYRSDPTFPSFRFKAKTKGRHISDYCCLVLLYNRTIKGRKYCLRMVNGVKDIFGEGKDVIVETVFNNNYGWLFKMSKGRKKLFFMFSEDGKGMDLIDPAQQVVIDAVKQKTDAFGRPISAKGAKLKRLDAKHGRSLIDEMIRCNKFTDESITVLPFRITSDTNCVLNFRNIGGKKRYPQIRSLRLKPKTDYKVSFLFSKNLGRWVCAASKIYKNGKTGEPVIMFTEKEKSGQKRICVLRDKEFNRCKKEFYKRLILERIRDDFSRGANLRGDARRILQKICNAYGIQKGSKLAKEAAKLFFTYRFFSVLKGIRKSIDKNTKGVKDIRAKNKIIRNELKILRSNQFEKKYKPIYARLRHYYKSYKSVFKENSAEIAGILGFEVNYERDICGNKNTINILKWLKEKWLEGERRQIPKGFSIHVGKTGSYSLLKYKKIWLDLRGLTKGDYWLSFSEEKGGRIKYTVVWEDEDAANTKGAKPIQKYKIAEGKKIFAQRLNEKPTSKDRSPQLLIEKSVSKIIRRFVLKDGAIPPGFSAKVKGRGTDDLNGVITLCGFADFQLYLSTYLSEFVGKTLWITFEKDSERNKFAVVWKSEEESKANPYGYLRKYYIVKDGIVMNQAELGKKGNVIRTKRRPVIFTWKDKKRLIVEGRGIKAEMIKKGEGIDFLVSRLLHPDPNISNNVKSTLIEWLGNASGVRGLLGFMNPRDSSKKGIAMNSAILDILESLKEFLDYIPGHLSLFANYPNEDLSNRAMRLRDKLLGVKGKERSEEPERDKIGRVETQDEEKEIEGSIKNMEGAVLKIVKEVRQRLSGLGQVESLGKEVLALIEFLRKQYSKIKRISEKVEMETADYPKLAEMVDKIKGYERFVKGELDKFKDLRGRLKENIKVGDRWAGKICGWAGIWVISNIDFGEWKITLKTKVGEEEKRREISINSLKVIPRKSKRWKPGLDNVLTKWMGRDASRGNGSSGMSGASSHRFRKDLRKALENEMRDAELKEEIISRVLERGLAWIEGANIYFEDDNIFNIAARALNNVLGKKVGEQITPEQIKAVMEYHEMVHVVLRKNRQIISAVDDSIKKNRSKLFRYFKNQYGKYDNDERLVEELIASYYTEKILINSLEILNDEGKIVIIENIHSRIVNIIEKYAAESVGGIDFKKLKFRDELIRIFEARRAEKSKGTQPPAPAPKMPAPVPVMSTPLSPILAPPAPVPAPHVTALPAPKRAGAISVRDVLFNEVIDPENLDAENKKHRSLLRYNDFNELLAGAGEDEKAALKARYMERFSPLVIEFYELLLDRQIKRFPRGIWKGEKGRLHQIIITRYLFEKILGFRMNEKNRKIDKRFFRKGQKRFLRSQKVKYWFDFFKKYGLDGMMKYTCRHSITVAIQMAYPWVFDYETPEGQHIHYHDFARISKIVGRDEYTKTAIQHIMEKHLHLVNPKKKTFSKALNPKNSKKIYRRFQIEGIEHIFRDRFGFSIKKMLMEYYPWVFDLERPEGEHLHEWEFKEDEKWAGNGQDEMIKRAGWHIILKHLRLNGDRDFILAKVDKRILGKEGLPLKMFAQRFSESLMEFLHLCFPNIFPQGDSFPAFLLEYKYGRVDWERTPVKYQKWLAQMAMIELEIGDGEISALFYVPFYGKTLRGLLDFYKKGEKGDRKGRERFEKEVLFNPEIPDFLIGFVKDSESPIQTVERVLREYGIEKEAATAVTAPAPPALVTKERIIERVKTGDKLEDLTAEVGALSLLDMWQIVLAYNDVIEERGYTWARKMQLWFERNFWREQIWKIFKERNEGKKRLRWMDFAKEIQADPKEFRKTCYDYLLEKHRGDLKAIKKGLAGNCNEFESEKGVKSRIKNGGLAYKWYLVRALKKIDGTGEELDVDEVYALIYGFIAGNHRKDPTFPSFWFKTKTRAYPGKKNVYFMRLYEGTIKREKYYLIMFDGVKDAFGRGQDVRVESVFFNNYGWLFKVSNGDKELFFMLNENRKGMDLIDPVQQVVVDAVMPKLDVRGMPISAKKTKLKMLDVKHARMFIREMITYNKFTDENLTVLPFKITSDARSRLGFRGIKGQKDYPQIHNAKLKPNTEYEIRFMFSKSLARWVCVVCEICKGGVPGTPVIMFTGEEKDGQTRLRTLNDNEFKICEGEFTDYLILEEIKDDFEKGVDLAGNAGGILVKICGGYGISRESELGREVAKLFFTYRFFSVLQQIRDRIDEKTKGIKDKKTLSMARRKELKILRSNRFKKTHRALDAAVPEPAGPQPQRKRIGFGAEEAAAFRGEIDFIKGKRKEAMKIRELVRVRINNMRHVKNFRDVLTLIQFLKEKLSEIGQIWKEVEPKTTAHPELAEMAGKIKEYKEIVKAELNKFNELRKRLNLDKEDICVGDRWAGKIGGWAGAWFIDDIDIGEWKVTFRNSLGRQEVFISDLKVIPLGDERWEGKLDNVLTGKAARSKQRDEDTKGVRDTEEHYRRSTEKGRKGDIYRMLEMMARKENILEMDVDALILDVQNKLPWASDIDIRKMLAKFRKINKKKEGWEEEGAVRGKRIPKAEKFSLRDWVVFKTGELVELGKGVIVHIDDKSGIGTVYFPDAPVKQRIIKINLKTKSLDAHKTAPPKLSEDARREIEEYIRVLEVEEKIRQILEKKVEAANNIRDAALKGVRVNSILEKKVSAIESILREMEEVGRTKRIDISLYIDKVKRYRDEVKGLLKNKRVDAEERLGKSMAHIFGNERANFLLRDGPEPKPHWRNVFLGQLYIVKRKEIKLVIGGLGKSFERVFVSYKREGEKSYAIIWANNEDWGIANESGSLDGYICKYLIKDGGTIYAQEINGEKTGRAPVKIEGEEIIETPEKEVRREIDKAATGAEVSRVAPSEPPKKPIVKSSDEQLSLEGKRLKIIEELFKYGKVEIGGRTLELSKIENGEQVGFLLGLLTNPNTEDARRACKLLKLLKIGKESEGALREILRRMDPYSWVRYSNTVKINAMLLVVIDFLDIADDMVIRHLSNFAAYPNKGIQKKALRIMVRLSERKRIEDEARRRAGEEKKRLEEQRKMEEAKKWTRAQVRGEGKTGKAAITKPEREEPAPQGHRKDNVAKRQDLEEKVRIARRHMKEALAYVEDIDAITDLNEIHKLDLFLREKVSMIERILREIEESDYSDKNWHMERVFVYINVTNRQITILNYHRKKLLEKEQRKKARKPNKRSKGPMRYRVSKNGGPGCNPNFPKWRRGGWRRLGIERISSAGFLKTLCVWGILIGACFIASYFAHGNSIASILMAGSGILPFAVGAVLGGGSGRFKTVLSMHKPLREWIVGRVNGMGKNLRILLVDSETGDLELDLKNAGHNVTCTNVAPKKVRYLMERGLNAVCGDAYDVRSLFSSDKFDIVIYPESIGYLKRNSAYREAKKVLKERGRIIVITYPDNSKFSPPDYEKQSMVNVAGDLNLAGFGVDYTVFVGDDETKVDILSPEEENAAQIIYAEVGLGTEEENEIDKLRKSLCERLNKVFTPILKNAAHFEKLNEDELIYVLTFFYDNRQCNSEFKLSEGNNELIPHILYLIEESKKGQNGIASLFKNEEFMEMASSYFALYFFTYYHKGIVLLIDVGGTAEGKVRRHIELVEEFRKAPARVAKHNPLIIRKGEVTLDIGTGLSGIQIISEKEQDERIYLLDNNPFVCKVLEKYINLTGKSNVKIIDDDMTVMSKIGDGEVAVVIAEDVLGFDGSKETRLGEGKLPAFLRRVERILADGGEFRISFSQNPSDQEGFYAAVRNFEKQERELRTKVEKDLSCLEAEVLKLKESEARLTEPFDESSEGIINMLEPLGFRISGKTVRFGEGLNNITVTITAEKGAVNIPELLKVRSDRLRGKLNELSAGINISALNDSELIYLLCLIYDKTQVSAEDPVRLENKGLVEYIKNKAGGFKGELLPTAAGFFAVFFYHELREWAREFSGPMSLEERVRRHDLISEICRKAPVRVCKATLPIVPKGTVCLDAGAGFSGIQVITESAPNEQIWLLDNNPFVIAVLEEYARLTGKTNIRIIDDDLTTFSKIKDGEVFMLMLNSIFEYQDDTETRFGRENIEMVLRNAQRILRNGGNLNIFYAQLGDSELDISSREVRDLLLSFGFVIADYSMGVRRDGFIGIRITAVKGLGEKTKKPKTKQELQGLMSAAVKDGISRLRKDSDKLEDKIIWTGRIRDSAVTLPGSITDFFGKGYFCDLISADRKTEWQFMSRQNNDIPFMEVKGAVTNFLLKDNAKALAAHKVDLKSEVHYIWIDWFQEGPEAGVFRVEVHLKSGDIVKFGIISAKNAGLGNKVVSKDAENLITVRGLYERFNKRRETKLLYETPEVYQGGYGACSQGNLYMFMVEWLEYVYEVYPYLNAKGQYVYEGWYRCVPVKDCDLRQSREIRERSIMIGATIFELTNGRAPKIFYGNGDLVADVDDKGNVKQVYLTTIPYFYDDDPEIAEIGGGRKCLENLQGLVREFNLKDKGLDERYILFIFAMLNVATAVDSIDGAIGELAEVFTEPEIVFSGITKALIRMYGEEEGVRRAVSILEKFVGKDTNFRYEAIDYLEKLKRRYKVNEGANAADIRKYLESIVPGSFQAVSLQNLVKKYELMEEALIGMLRELGFMSIQGDEDRWKRVENEFHRIYINLAEKMRKIYPHWVLRSEEEIYKAVFSASDSFWAGLVYAMRKDGSIDEEDFLLISRMGQIVESAASESDPEIKALLTAELAKEYLRDFSGFIREIEKRLGQLGYGDKAGEIISRLGKIEMNKNTGELRLSRASEYHFIIELERILGYEREEIFNEILVNHFRERLKGKESKLTVKYLRGDLPEKLMEFIERKLRSKPNGGVTLYESFRLFKEGIRMFKGLKVPKAEILIKPEADSSVDTSI